MDRVDRASTNTCTFAAIRAQTQCGNMLDMLCDQVNCLFHSNEENIVEITKKKACRAMPSHVVPGSLVLSELKIINIL